MQMGIPLEKVLFQNFKSRGGGSHICRKHRKSGRANEIKEARPHAFWGESKARLKRETIIFAREKTWGTGQSPGVMAWQKKERQQNISTSQKSSIGEISGSCSAGLKLL